MMCCGCEAFLTNCPIHFHTVSTIVYLKVCVPYSQDHQSHDRLTSDKKHVRNDANWQISTFINCDFQHCEYSLVFPPFPPSLQWCSISCCLDSRRLVCLSGRDLSSPSTSARCTRYTHTCTHMHGIIITSQKGTEESAHTCKAGFTFHTPTHFLLLSAVPQFLSGGEQPPWLDYC